MLQLSMVAPLQCLAEVVRNETKQGGTTVLTGKGRELEQNQPGQRFQSCYELWHFPLDSKNNCCFLFGLV